MMPLSNVIAYERQPYMAVELRRDAFCAEPELFTFLRPGSRLTIA